MEPRCEKTGLRGFPTRSHTNQAVQPHKMARGLKFRMYEVEGLSCLCSAEADLRHCFRICKKPVFSRCDSTYPDSSLTTRILPVVTFRLGHLVLLVKGKPQTNGKYIKLPHASAV